MKTIQYRGNLTFSQSANFCMCQYIVRTFNVKHKKIIIKAHILTYKNMIMLDF